MSLVAMKHFSFSPFLFYCYHLIMKVNVKSNIKAVTKGITKTQRKQIPFATANAINKTLFQLRKEMAKQTEKKLDRPIPFTQKGFLIDKAKKNKLTGVLVMNPAGINPVINFFLLEFIDSMAIKYIFFFNEGS